jgi:hypothetical protein
MIFASECLALRRGTREYRRCCVDECGVARFVTIRCDDIADLSASRLYPCKVVVYVERHVVYNIDHQSGYQLTVNLLLLMNGVYKIILLFIIYHCRI